MPDWGIDKPRVTTEMTISARANREGVRIRAGLKHRAILRSKDVMNTHALTSPPTDELRAIFADRFISDGAELDRVCRDESRYSPEGTALGAVFPETTEEVAAALQWANHNNVTVSVRGTGTGLSGGALATLTDWSSP